MDTLNGNTLWAEYRKLEMINVGVAFELLKPGGKAPPGWKKASDHLNYDVKMGFTQKNMGKGRPSNTQPQNIMLCWGCILFKQSVMRSWIGSALLDLN